MDYFKRRKELTDHARFIVDKMDKEHKDEINNSIVNTKIYREKINIEPNIILDDIDSVSAIFKYLDERIAVLNFASYKNPGGKFYDGSSAQEESLCHNSTLYNILREFENSYYDENRKDLNKGLYKNAILYSPNVLFIDKDDMCFCDVITCASPNKMASQKYQNVSDEENSKYLDERIKFVLDCAFENKVDTLILGAFGCGVFGQNPIEVATIFKKYLKNYNFKRVIFAIPDSNSNNYKAFKEILYGI